MLQMAAYTRRQDEAATTILCLTSSAERPAGGGLMEDGVRGWTFLYLVAVIQSRSRVRLTVTPQTAAN